MLENMLDFWECHPLFFYVLLLRIFWGDPKRSLGCSTALQNVSMTLKRLLYPHILTMRAGISRGMVWAVANFACETYALW